MKKTILILAITLCAVSCRRLPLYDPMSDIYIKFNYTLETAVRSDFSPLEGDTEAASKLRLELPQRVKVCFYDTEDHRLVFEDFLPPDGGFVNAPAGVWDIVAYSLGTESTMVEGYLTRAGSLAHTGTPGTKVMDIYPVIYEPDHLLAGRLTEAVIPIHADTDKATVVEIGMEPLLETYTFELRRVEGYENIQKAEVFITGQASSRYLWDKRLNIRPCAVCFTLRGICEDNSLRTVFNTFGKLPGEKSDAFINILVTAKSGGRYQWIYNVTDQFDNPDNTDHRIIVDAPISVPTGGGGGFQSDVNDWEAEIVHIPL